MVQFEPSRCLRGYLLDAVGRVEKFTSGGVHGAPATVLHDLGRVEKGQCIATWLEWAWCQHRPSLGGREHGALGPIAKSPVGECLHPAPYDESKAKRAAGVESTHIAQH